MSKEIEINGIKYVKVAGKCIDCAFSSDNMSVQTTPCLEVGYECIDESIIYIEKP